MKWPSLFFGYLLILSACSQPDPVLPVPLGPVYNEGEMTAFRLSASDKYLAFHDGQTIFVHSLEYPADRVDSLTLPDSIWTKYHDPLDTAATLVAPQDHFHPYIQNLNKYSIECASLSGDSLLFALVKFNYPEVKDSATQLNFTRMVLGFDRKQKTLKYEIPAFQEASEDAFFGYNNPIGIPLIWKSGLPGLLMTGFDLIENRSSSQFNGKYLVHFENNPALNYVITKPDTSISRLWNVGVSGYDVACFGTESMHLFEGKELVETLEKPAKIDYFIDVEKNKNGRHWLYWQRDTVAEFFRIGVYRNDDLIFQDTIYSPSDMGHEFFRSKEDLLFFYRKNGETMLTRF